MITNLQPKEDTPAGTMRQQQLQGSELEGNRPRGLIHMNKETVIRHLATKKDKNSIMSDADDAKHKCGFPLVLL